MGGDYQDYDGPMEPPDRDFNRDQDGRWISLKVVAPSWCREYEKPLWHAYREPGGHGDSFCGVIIGGSPLISHVYPHYPHIICEYCKKATKPS